MKIQEQMVRENTGLNLWQCVLEMCWNNGSVIPLFKKQIAKGGPVTVTHRTLSVIADYSGKSEFRAETYAKGGEIFVLDMELR